MAHGRLRPYFQCKRQRLFLQTNQVAHQATAYPGFRSVKQLGIYRPAPLPWMESYSIARLSPALNLPVPICTPGSREAMWECLAQEHNTMSPVRAQTRTARFGEGRTTHPPHDWQETHIYHLILVFVRHKFNQINVMIYHRSCHSLLTELQISSNVCLWCQMIY